LQKRALQEIEAPEDQHPLITRQDVMDQVNQIPVHREPDFGGAKKWQQLPKKMGPLIFGGIETSRDDAIKKEEKSGLMEIKQPLVEEQRSLHTSHILRRHQIDEKPDLLSSYNRQCSLKEFNQKLADKEVHVLKLK